jgi:hypothetical protein
MLGSPQQATTDIFRDHIATTDFNSCFLIYSNGYIRKTKRDLSHAAIDKIALTWGAGHSNAAASAPCQYAAFETFYVACILY